LHSKKLGAAALLRSARGSAARLPPSEVGEFADFTVRVVVRRLVSATECIDTVYLQKKHSRSEAFSTGCSEKYAGIESDFTLPKLDRQAYTVVSKTVVRVTVPWVRIPPSPPAAFFMLLFSVY
jgi:hypothetical protein